MYVCLAKALFTQQRLQTSCREYMTQILNDLELSHRSPMQINLFYTVQSTHRIAGNWS